MSKRMVVCVSCGRRFDTSKGFYYNKMTGRYTCPKCGKAQKKAIKSAEADEREERTGMRQTVGAMIAKIVFGVLFIVTSFSMDSASSTIIGIVIGLALLAWGLLPWLLPRLKAKKEADAAAAAAAAEAERLANEPKVCPVCGAHTKGEKCEYCGSPLK